MTARTYLFAAAAIQGLIVAGASAQQDLRLATATAGLTPTMFTVIGLEAGDVAGIFTSVRGTAEVDAVIAARSAVQAAECALKVALQECDPMEPEGFAAIQSAIGATVQAKAVLESAVGAFVARAAGVLSEPQRQAMEIWRSAPAELAPEFRAVWWSPAESALLLSALRAERIALASQAPLSAAAGAVLSEARGRAEVVRARWCLDVNLAQVSQAFEQAMQ